MMDWKQLLYFGLASGAALSMLRKRVPPVHTATLMYHDLAHDDADIEAWTVVRESDFLRQIDYLGRHYEFVTLDQAIARMHQGDTRPMAVITFDDGDRGNATVLRPIIESLRIPVTIYVATRQVAEASGYWFDQIVNALQTNHTVNVDLRAHGLDEYAINQVRGSKNWEHIQRLLEDLKSLSPEARVPAVSAALTQLKPVERRHNSQVEPMSIDELKALAACPYVTIGAHSHCHNILTQLDAAEAENSVRLSKALLEQWLERPMEHFAYPNGSYNDTVADIVRHAGFRTATCTDWRLWQRQDSLHKIPRIAIGRYDTLEKFKLNLLGGARALLPWRRSPYPAHACTP